MKRFMAFADLVGKCLAFVAPSLEAVHIFIPLAPSTDDVLYSNHLL